LYGRSHIVFREQGSITALQTSVRTSTYLDRGFDAWGELSVKAFSPAEKLLLPESGLLSLQARANESVVFDHRDLQHGIGPIASMRST
jgi:hypothetical protein